MTAPPSAPRAVPDLDVTVLVPTCDRTGALAVTLAGLLGQWHLPREVVLSDQGDGAAVRLPEVRAVLRVLELQGVEVQYVRHLPRRGVAENRAHLLALARTPMVLFLDDDVYLEPPVLSRLVGALTGQGCGFVGAFPEASGAVRSDAPVNTPGPDVHIELWEGAVRPERILPGSPAWERRHLHFAAHPRRVAVRDGLLDGVDRLYKVAWVGGCVLYDAGKLRAVGGFDFWRDLPSEHVGEDVLAQLRVMAAFGGAGLLPSGAWHLEVPTTLRNRTVDAPLVLAPHVPVAVGTRSAGITTSHPGY
jgi:glycosyltransferase involved in cell wall biosynthesis